MVRQPAPREESPVTRRMRLCVAVLILGSLLLSGCRTEQGTELRYRLRVGESFRYWYHEVMTSRSAQETLRYEISYRLTLTVVAVDRSAAQIELVMEEARVAVTPEGGQVSDWRSERRYRAELVIHPVTGEVFRTSGEIIIPMGSSTTDVVQAFRQYLQQYPEKAPAAGSTWTTPVHEQLLEGHTTGFRTDVRYESDEERGGHAAARLRIDGEGDLKGGGRIGLRSTAWVSRTTGMPVHEEGEAWLEMEGLKLTGSYALTAVR
jgi:hypothetical protein